MRLTPLTLESIGLRMHLVLPWVYGNLVSPVGIGLRDDLKEDNYVTFAKEFDSSDYLEDVNLCIRHWESWLSLYGVL